MMILSENARQELREFRRTQESLVEDYLSNEQFEMSYVAQWSILEHGVKNIAVEYRKAHLLESLKSWMAYIENGGPKPKAAPKTVIEKISLPQKVEFLAALKHFGIDANVVWSAMDSRGRHRRHRNEIAHTGKRFINHLLYRQLMDDLGNAARALYEDI